MANSVLFTSSLFLGFLHMALIIFYQPVPRILAFTITCGTFSSIWNHGVTSEIAKWTDRGIMVIGTTVDFIYIIVVNATEAQRTLLITLMSTALAGYTFAKITIGGNLPHLLAHICLSFAHFILIVCVEPSWQLSAAHNRVRPVSYMLFGQDTVRAE
jgi:hypothetical protein